MNLAYIFSILFFSLNSNASEVASSAEAPTASTSAKPSAVGTPVALGDCTPAKEKPEGAARKLAEAADLSKEELLARLIYSESLSTGYWNGLCNANSTDDILTSVGWGIMNRVKSKATASLDAYSDVIFGPKQFSTSFSGAKPNPFAESFLCPANADKYLSGSKKKTPSTLLYNKAQQVASQIVSEFEKNGIPKQYKGITNFFYPQSEYFGEMRPKWAPDKDPSKNKGYLNLLSVESKPCVEFYRLK